MGRGIGNGWPPVVEDIHTLFPRSLSDPQLLKTVDQFLNCGIQFSRTRHHASAETWLDLHITTPTQPSFTMGKPAEMLELGIIEIF